MLHKQNFSRMKLHEYLLKGVLLLLIILIKINFAEAQTANENHNGNSAGTGEDAYIINTNRSGGATRLVLNASGNRFALKANQVDFKIWSDDGLAGDTPLFTLKKDGKLGLGTTSPFSKFSVIGNRSSSSNAGLLYLGASGTGANLRLGVDTDYTWIQSHGIKPLYINGAGNNTIINSGNGNVGIGTNSPLSKLHVSGETNGTFESFMLENKSSGSNALSILRIRNNNSRDLVLFKNSSTKTTDGGHNVGTLRNDGGHLRLQSKGSKGIFIQETSGKVGIGTSSPWHEIHVKGNILVQKKDDGSKGIIFTDHIKGLDDIHLNHEREGKVIVGASSTANANLIVWNNIGVGTESPSEKLQVNGNIKIAGSKNLYTRHIKGQDYNGDGTNILYLQHNQEGNVEIGKSGVNTNLIVNRNITVKNDLYSRGHVFFHAFEGENQSGTAYIQARDNSGNTNLDFQFRTQNQGDLVEAMKITKEGNVGIGTNLPGTYKLAVNGNVKAKQVEVNSDGWADYVFEENYDLRTLSEVSDFISKNGHLPDVPSAKEVTENGINLGEMDAVLLRKIEELTLYTIQQEKELHQQKERIKNLELLLKKLVKDN